MSPDKATAKADAEREITEAARGWREAKAREREARAQLAALVNAHVAAGVLTENKIAKVTDIPRMTIRKMLGKN